MRHALLKQEQGIIRWTRKEVKGKMKSKLKVLAVALVTIAIVGVLLYTPLINALQSDEGQKSDIEMPNNMNLASHPRGKSWLRARLGESDVGTHNKRARAVWWFLNHSEPVEVKGTAVALFKSMLIVNTVEGQIRIHLPPAWIVSEEQMMREELFESGYLSVDESITVKALRADMIEKEELCIYLLLGYEIIDEDGAHAYAVLPFNIQD